MRPLFVCAAGLLLLAACGEAEPAEPAGPVAVATVRERVDYYGACGNEILIVDGVAYYPIHNEAYPGNNEDSSTPDFDRYRLAGAMRGIGGRTVGSAAAVPMVAPARR